MQVGKEDELNLRWFFSPQEYIEAVHPRFAEKITGQQKHAVEEVRKLVTAKHKLFMLGMEKLNEEEKKYAKKIGVSIMSGKGTGKDAIAAIIIDWWLTTSSKLVKIGCIAPTKPQLRDVLWSEISKWHKQSLLYDGSCPGNNTKELLSERFFIKGHSQDRFAVARTANVKDGEASAAALDGLHSDYLLIVLDEAASIHEKVFKALVTTLTGPMNWVFMIFNPTNATGSAVKSHTEQREEWVCLRWDAEDSENVTKESIERMERLYGRDSNAFRVWVKGLPPKADPDTLIPWDWVMDAVGRDIEPCEDDPVVMGIDVARFGDDRSVICTRKGGLVDEFRAYEKMDTEIIAGWAMGAIADDEPSCVMVDTIGIGAGVADKLRHRVGNVEIVDINVSETPSEKEKFKKLRDELWWNTRELFEKRVISIPDDDELIAELTIPTYRLDDGKVKVMSKKEMKKKRKDAELGGYKSPDKADALVFTTYFNQETLRKMANPTKKNKWRYEEAASWRTV